MLKSSFKMLNSKKVHQKVAKSALLKSYTLSRQNAVNIFLPSVPVFADNVWNRNLYCQNGTKCWFLRICHPAWFWFDSCSPSKVFSARTQRHGRRDRPRRARNFSRNIASRSYRKCILKLEIRKTVLQKCIFEILNTKP